MKRSYLSIDIGGTNVKYAELNNAGQIIEKGKIKSVHKKAEFLTSIDILVKRYIERGIKRLAFCAPGKIEHTEIHFGGALPFLDGVDFAKRYLKYRIPVGVINDGKASVLAENWLGSLKNSKNCAAITLGTGVGGGIISNGHLINGAHFQAGELSFMKLNIGGFDSSNYAGNIASAVGMISSINKKLRNQDKKDGLAAFKAINANNPDAVAIFKKYCQSIVNIIINVQAVVDLDSIAIGGGISAQPIVIKGINQSYNKAMNENEMIKNTLTRPKIVEAKFKNDANLYGALYNLLLRMNDEKL